MNTFNPIQDELKQLGIQLPAHGKMPYHLPEAYFSDFEHHLQQELKEVRFLDTLPKNLPFNTPELYFEDFAANLKTAILLDQLPSSNPFEVPSNYFDQVEESVKKRIQPATKPRADIRPFKRWYANLSIAATLFLFVSIGFNIMNKHTKPTVAQQLSKLPDAEIERYLQDHQNEFLSDVESFNTESTIDVKKLEQDVFDNQFKNISQEELSNYL